MSKPLPPDELTERSTPLPLSDFGHLDAGQLALPTANPSIPPVATINLGNLAGSLPELESVNTAQMIAPVLPALDTGRATAFFKRNYHGQTPHEICAMAVRLACQKAGIAFPHNPRFARQYDAFLPTQGFARIAEGQAGRFEDAATFYEPMHGDIVVIQKPGTSGHIAMYGDDNRWHADFVHPSGDMFGIKDRTNPHTTFAVFRHPTLGGALANAIALVDPATPPALTAGLGNLRIETSGAPAFDTASPQLTIRRDTVEAPAQATVSTAATHVRLNMPGIKS